MDIGKIALGFLIGCSALASYGAFQYDTGRISASSAGNGNSEYAAFVDRGAKIGLLNALYFNSPAYLYLSFGKGESELGTYYLGGRDQGKQIFLTEVDENLYSATDGTGRVIEFQEGDSIGFWVRDSNGMTVYNTPGVGGQKNVYNGTAIVNGDTYVVAFGEYGQYVRSPNGGFTYSDMFEQASSILYVQVATTEPALPNGQPLPGVLAALVAGGGAWLGYRRMKAGKK